MAYKYALAMVGPTTTGKTDIAFEIARRVGGEVVNLDLYYLYDGFSIASGLSDTLKLHRSTGVPIHLYQVLGPKDPYPTNEEYAGMVNRVVIDILKRGKLPIIEGCSLRYAKELLINSPHHHMYSTVVGLKWPDVDGDPGDINEECRHRIMDRISNRLEFMIEAGALDEIDKDYPRYYAHRLPWDDVIITPLVTFSVDYIRKYLVREHADTLKEVKAQIVEGYYQYVIDDFWAFMGLFGQLDNATWVSHDTSDSEATITEIIDMLE